MSSIWHYRALARHVEHHRVEPEPARHASACRSGASGATGVLAGILLSGPLSLALVSATHPQPPWQGARVFADAYHPIQLLPYLGGIVLVVALVVLIASARELASEVHKARAGAALVLSSVFAALIFFNYVVQTTFLPDLAWHYDEAYAAIIGAFSMSNPTSLAWGIEMWGWGLLGMATWLVAPVFRGSRLERATSLVFAANGAVSVAGALLTRGSPGLGDDPGGTHRLPRMEPASDGARSARVGRLSPARQEP